MSVRHLHGSSFCSFAFKTGYKGIGLIGQFCYDYQAVSILYNLSVTCVQEKGFTVMLVHHPAICMLQQKHNTVKKIQNKTSQMALNCKAVGVSIATDILNKPNTFPINENNIP